MDIYRITNKINGKVYVGQTKIQPEERWDLHTSGYGGARLVKAAIEKYGAGYFTFEVIDSAFNQADLDDKERHWIAHHQSNNPERGYNLTIGGQDLGYRGFNSEALKAHDAGVSEDRGRIKRLQKWGRYDLYIADEDEDGYVEPDSALDDRTRRPYVEGMAAALSIRPSIASRVRPVAIRSIRSADSLDVAPDLIRRYLKGEPQAREIVAAWAPKLPVVRVRSLPENNFQWS